VGVRLGVSLSPAESKAVQNHPATAGKRFPPPPPQLRARNDPQIKKDVEPVILQIAEKYLSLP